MDWQGSREWLKSQNTTQRNKKEDKMDWGDWCESCKFREQYDDTSEFSCKYFGQYELMCSEGTCPKYDEFISDEEFRFEKKMKRREWGDRPRKGKGGDVDDE